MGGVNGRRVDMREVGVGWFGKRYERKVLVGV